MSSARGRGAYRYTAEAGNDSQPVDNEYETDGCVLYFHLHTSAANLFCLSIFSNIQSRRSAALPFSGSGSVSCAAVKFGRDVILWKGQACRP